MRFDIGKGTRAFFLGLGVLLAACSPQAGEPETVETEDPNVIPVGGEGRPQTLAAATEGPSAVPLWRVSDEDTVVYILGTVPLMRTDLRWKRPAIETALEAADAVYLEADLFSKNAQRSMGVVVSQTAELDADLKLTSFYDARTQEALNEKLGKIGVNLSRIDTYRPWFAAMQASVLAMIKAGGDPAAEANVVIAREMHERGTPLRYLETAAQQLAMKASGKDERDAAYFYDLMEDLSLAEGYYADLLGAWYEGDLERLDFLLNARLEDYPQKRKRVRTDRNIGWAQQVDRLLTDEAGTFVLVVDAAQMVGEDSLPRAIEGRGYAVERL